ncbi:hypothetical protein AB0C77_37440, partial [Streptomyces sp. NPDC048629]|uniref:hypothetical protein n=1 Tax=Streptomyces sp. NPDC048629 TaxID=3154824 RepID=UPI003423EEBA
MKSSTPTTGQVAVALPEGVSAEGLTAQTGTIEGHQLPESPQPGGRLERRDSGYSSISGGDKDTGLPPNTDVEGSVTADLDAQLRARVGELRSSGGTAPLRSAEIVETVGRTLESFPELREVAGDRPLEQVWEVLSPAQRVKFEHLMNENGLASFPELRGELAGLLGGHGVGSTGLEQPAPLPLEARVKDAVTRTIGQDPELLARFDGMSLADVYGSLTDAQKTKFEYQLRANGLRDAAVDLVGKTLQSFPELVGTAATQRPLTDVWDALTPAQQTKFAYRLNKLGFEHTGLDVAQALTADGVLGLALAEHGGTLQDLLPQTVQEARPAAGLDAVLEQRALAQGMTRQEWSLYQERYEAAVGKGDLDAAGVIAEQRDAHVAVLEAANAELVFRSGREKAANPDGVEQRPLDLVGAAREQALDAGLSEGAWDATETLIDQALAEGRVADAHALILDRNEMVSELEAAARERASADGVADADLEARLDRLREGRKAPETDELPRISGELTLQEVQALLDAPAPPRLPRSVDGRDVQMLESLVARSRTAEMPASEITRWRERFAEAWGKGGEGRGEIGELGRLWHRELEQLTGGSSRPSVRELFDAPEARAQSAQESLARAAEDAGVPFTEHAQWMRQIRDAWAQGRPEDAAALVERFWGRIEEAQAARSQATELELAAQMARLRGVPLEEFWAQRQRLDDAERALRESLASAIETPVEKNAQGLHGRLREIFEGLPEEAVASPFAEGLKEILARNSGDVVEQRLRDEVGALLDQEVGPRTLSDAEAEILARLKALPRTPTGDAVWAEGVMNEAMELYGESSGMPQGEIAYWQDKLQGAVEGGSRQAVIDVVGDWLSRFRQFESVRSLAGQAGEAGMFPGEVAGWQEELRAALRQENPPEFARLQSRWSSEIARVKAETEFWQSVDDVSGSLQGKAERFGMAEEEWNRFDTRVEQARHAGDLAEVLRLIDERAQRLDDLETTYDAGLGERLSALREGGSGLGPELEAYREAVEPEWRTERGEVSAENGLWSLFEEKKPETLKDRFDDPDEHPLRELDNDNDGDGPGDWGGDVQRRLKNLQGDVFADARRAGMTRQELKIWELRIEAADDPVAVKEELRRRIDDDLIRQAELDARMAAFGKARRQELLDLGFTPYELNAHEVGVDAAGRRGDIAMAMSLTEAFEAKVAVRRHSLDTDPTHTTTAPESPGAGSRPLTGRSSSTRGTRSRHRSVRTCSCRCPWHVDAT